MEVYNTATDTWAELPSMPTKRSECAAAVLGGCIYVVGGHKSAGAKLAGGDKDKYLDTVEKYDISTRVWSTVAPLLQGRFAPAACVSNGRLCVVGGGGDNSEPLVTLEVYDAADNTWKTEGGALNQTRYGLAVVVVENTADELQRRAAAARRLHRIEELK
jgi:hypothetical protein